MMNEQKLAQLVTKLQTPLAVRDIISGDEQFDNDARGALNDALSDTLPDTALLTAALSGKYIAQRYADHSTQLKILNMECDRIIEDYGYIWLKNAQNQEIDEDALYDTLVNTAEDLEGLSELLEYNQHSLRDVNYEAAELCNILQIQARAQIMIAEAFIASAQEAMAEDEPETSIPDAGTISALQTQTGGNNVIQFPSSTS